MGKWHTEMLRTLTGYEDKDHIMFLSSSYGRRMSYFLEIPQSTPVVSANKPGAHTDDIWQYLDGVYETRPEATLTFKTVILQIGSNDIADRQGNPRQEVLGSRCAKIGGELHDMKEAIQDKFCCRCILSTPLPRNLCNPENRDRYNNIIRRIESRLKDWCIPDLCLNTRLFLKGSKNITEDLFQKDGVHLSIDGQSLLSENICQML